MEKIAVVSMRPPYGDINAAEAVRHALGAVGEGLEVSMLLVEDGVLLARAGGEAGESGFTDLTEAVADCVEMGVAVYADRESVLRLGLAEGQIVKGVRTVESSGVSEIIAHADRTIIF